MDRLSSILPKVLRKRGLHGEMTASLIVMLCQRWIEVSMPTMAPALRVLRFADGWVTVEADNSIALSECSQRRQEMIDWLLTQLPDAKLEGARVVRSKA